MALDPTDRDLLKIFADPSLTPQQKQQLLGGGGDIPPIAPLPPVVSGPPPGAVAGPGGGDAGDRGAIDAALAAQQGGAPPPVGFISDPTVANKPGIAGTVAQLQAEGPQPNPDAQPNPEGAPVAPAGAAPGNSGDYRGALRLMTPTGPAPVPMEQVHQSTSTSGSSVDPAQIAALGEAQQRRDADAMQQQIAEARIAQQSGDIQVSADKQAQAEKLALEATRQKALARADQILAQQDKISQQIVNTGPVMPGTMSSDNWSDVLFTTLSVMGAVGGASSPERATEAVQKLADREVQKQQASLDKNRSDLGTLGSLYGQHLENLKDHELAKQATIADIYGRAQAEVQAMIQQNGQAPDSLVNRKLQAQASALGAQRQEYMADVQAKLGPKIEQQEAISFVRKHVQPPTAPTVASSAVAPATSFGKRADGSEKGNGFLGVLKRPDGNVSTELSIGVNIDGKEVEIPTLVPTLTAKERDLLLSLPDGDPSKVPPEIIRKATAFAAQRLAAGKSPFASNAESPGRIATGNSDTKPRTPEDAINQAADLWNGGKPREALALLPPTVRTAVLAQAARSQKGLGEGATKEDALAYALHDLSNGQFQIPTSFIPQSAREKLVQIPGGAQGFATGKAQADKLQEEFNGDAGLVSAYQQLLSLASKPASAWSPEMRTKIDAISSLIRPMTAHSLGQRGMSAQEQELFDGISGHDINSVKDFMLGTGKAAAEQALQIARSRIRARARSLSRDPFDFVSIEGN